MKRPFRRGRPAGPLPRDPRRTVRWVAVAAALVSAGACLDLPVDEGRPTGIVLVANPATATVGETVIFTFEAQGTELFGVLVDYQDGVVDSVRAFGAQTMGADLEHAFTTAADHEVVATVFENSGRTVSDTVVVPVTEASGG